MSSPSYLRYLESRKGKQIKSLKGLAKAAEEKRSVFAPSLEWFRNPRPAAFVMRLQGHSLLYLFRSGMYVYKPCRDGFGKAPWNRKGGKDA